MIVVFMHGPAAAGKYTIGRELSERIGLPLFHNHLTVDLVRALFEFGSEDFVNLRAEIWQITFAQAATADKSFIFTFHPEATVAPETISEMVDIIETAGGRVAFVELQCSHAALLQRMGNESRRAFGKLVDAELYDRIAHDGGFDFPALPKSIITIDTEQTEPADAAKRIQEALRHFA